MAPGALGIVVSLRDVPGQEANHKWYKETQKGARTSFAVTFKGVMGLNPCYTIDEQTRESDDGHSTEALF